MTPAAELAVKRTGPAMYPPSADPNVRHLQHCRPRAMALRHDAVMLGLFLPCQSWGQWPTTAPSETEWTYGYNRRVTQLAEEIGFHFALPAARWKGISGDKLNWRGVSLDTITLAAGLIEATSKITIMATMHTSVFHPVVGAKICADLDQMSGGRFALNIVSGWNEDEFKSLAIPLLPHKDRYSFTREWLEIVRLLWENGECSYDGQFFKLDGAVARPLPVQNPRPILVNAGQSYTGMKFAADQVDYLFSYGARAHDFRTLAQKVQSDTGFVGLKKLLLRRTTSEAEDLASDIYRNLDMGALAGMRIASGSATPDTIGEWLSDPDNARKAVFEDGIVGSPDAVAEALAKWIIETRPNGICLTLYDYVHELELFREVIPKLSEMLSDEGLQLAPPPEERHPA
jgi:alkanesulfonate monooxygenase SsuD/methylene tetrahydromethanopterin reductase-like flavin-dependent oxidoreductase (luciferase family)